MPYNKEYESRPEVRAKRKQIRRDQQVKNRDYYQAYLEDYNTKHFLRHVIYAKRAECKQQSWAFDLDEEYLKSIVTDRCPITNVTLKYEYGKRSLIGENKATLDRIIPTKGYVKGNVAWISFGANTLKGGNTIETLTAITKYLTEHSC